MSENDEIDEEKIIETVKALVERNLCGQVDNHKSKLTVIFFMRVEKDASYDHNYTMNLSDLTVQIII